MRPQLLKVPKGPRHSFSVRRDLVPHVNNRWHYHPEVELIHFKKGEGTQFIGDSIKRFKAGDVVLIGAHLPHYWRFDDAYFEENTRHQADVRVAHFCENFWGNEFLDLPENVTIKSILEKSKRGLQINGKVRLRVAELLEKLLEADGSTRIVYLIERSRPLPVANWYLHFLHSDSNTIVAKAKANASTPSMTTRLKISSERFNWKKLLPWLTSVRILFAGFLNPEQGKHIRNS